MAAATGWVGRIVGIAGLVLCALAVLARLTGHYTLGGFQVGTILVAGIAALAAACFLMLWSAGGARSS
ncbi:MAG TPA: hypothetical protein VF925_01670 [Casimicrobiaceae bacterium]|jgi:hypothetical protein